MTVKFLAAIDRFQCLSSDSKPASAAVGSELLETDTGKRYVWDGSSWSYVARNLFTQGSGNADSTTLRVITAADGPLNTAVGATTDAAATGNGSMIALLKQLRTLLNGGLPASLTGDAASLKVSLFSTTDSQGYTVAKYNMNNGGGATVTVKSGAGVLYGLYVMNTTGSTIYLQVFDINGAPTLGTTQPEFAAGQAASGAGSIGAIPAGGFPFANGLRLAATTAIFGNTYAASGLLVTAIYK